ncbi:MAG TPA: 2-oxo acid dehydrogenase subunit E2 [Rectinemataceae bacterium]|nr:2-oxo acid dehydrogenase subunit E2 [Rectinemataceae bacterium]
MSNPVRMPKLGLTMEHGVIIKWTCKEGDLIKRGDVLLEVESDKATVDVESEFEGILLKRYYGEGTDVPCGENIALIGDAGEKISEPDARPAVAFKEPAAEEKDAVLSRGSDAGDGSVSTPNKGYIASPRARRFARQHGVNLSEIMKGSGGNDRIVERDVKNYLEIATNIQGAKASPVARNIMEASGVSVQDVKGSGPDGRIMKKNVLHTIEELARTAAAAVGPGTPKKVPLTSMRATIARRLSESKRSIPHYYMSISVNMETFINARVSYNATHPDRKVSMNAMLMKVIAVALMKHPDVNASWSDDGITYFPNADIALAVATETGLITPVVRNCDGKGVLEIDGELGDLISRARKGALKPQEFSGSTCTLSNLGMHGIEEFSAIINPPEAAILAVASIVDTPIAVGQTVVIKPMMKITMSGDHRVIDGAVGAEFLKDVRLILEQPFFGLF